MAVVGVDAELIDDLEGVFAPVLDVDQGVVQRRAVVADKAAALAEGARGGKDVGGDDHFKQPREFAFGQSDAIEGLELFTEIVLEGGAVVDVGAVGVFEVAQFADESVLDALLIDGERPGIWCRRRARAWPGSRGRRRRRRSQWRSESGPWRKQNDAAMGWRD